MRVDVLNISSKESKVFPIIANSVEVQRALLLFCIMSIGYLRDKVLVCTLLFRFITAINYSPPLHEHEEVLEASLGRSLQFV